MWLLSSGIIKSCNWKLPIIALDISCIISEPQESKRFKNKYLAQMIQQPILKVWILNFYKFSNQSDGRLKSIKNEQVSLVKLVLICQKRSNGMFLYHGIFNPYKVRIFWEGHKIWKKNLPLKILWPSQNIRTLHIIKVDLRSWM